MNLPGTLVLVDFLQSIIEVKQLLFLMKLKLNNYKLKRNLIADSGIQNDKILRRFSRFVTLLTNNHRTFFGF